MLSVFPNGYVSLAPLILARSMDQRPTKFAYYEKVVLVNAEGRFAPVTGQLAAVVGKSADDNGTLVGYAIYIYATQECWSVKEQDIRSTGEFDTRENLYSGESIRVDSSGTVI